MSNAIPSSDRYADLRERGAVVPFLGSRLGALLFGTLTYTLFLATFLYLIAFVAGVLVPKHIDSGTGSSLGRALLFDGGFLALFAVQHTIMARQAFKRRWTRIVPRVVERSIFVLVTCAILIGMVAWWQPLPEVVWHVDGTAAVLLWALCGIGWATVLVSTFLIDHFELFGLRQVVLNALGRAYEEPRFRERGLYRIVRHPLMLGFLIAFWSTPHMTVGHLFFAATITAYILIALQIEERSLISAHGEPYRDYVRRVPMLLPVRRHVA
jgi:protein-S-isoprenylcysteine O-methyltransferase Ste14